MERPPLDALAPLAREVAHRRRRARAYARSLSALAAFAGTALACAASFEPAGPGVVRALLSLAPLAAALVAAALAARLLPRDPLAQAALDPRPELVAAALARAAAPDRPAESPALLRRWAVQAVREAASLHRGSLAALAARAVAPVLLAALVPALAGVAWPARLARGVRALYVPGAEPDGARVGPVATVERVEVSLPRLPVAAVTPAPGRALVVPLGALMVVRGRVTLPGARRVALRRRGASAPEATAAPGADGAFELVYPVTASAELALEADRSPVERVRQRPPLRVVARADAPPVVRWRDGDGPLVLEGGALTVPFEVTDDRGVARVALVLRARSGESHRPLAYPEPGATRHEGEVTLDPARDLADATAVVEATDAAGLVGRSPPRRVVVRAAVDRRLARAAALRRVLDATVRLLARRLTSPAPDAPAPALARFRALRAETEALLDLVAEELHRRLGDPGAGGDAAAALVAMRDRVSERLVDESAVNDPAPGPRADREREDDAAERELEGDALLLDAMLEGELARAARDVARALRRGGDRDRAADRLEALAVASLGRELAPRVGAARDALGRGEAAARVADALAGPGEDGRGGSEAARQVAAEAARILEAERTVAAALRRARRPALPPRALREAARAVAARLRDEAERAGPRGAHAAARIEDARAALALGDAETARVLLAAASGDAYDARDDALGDALRSLGDEVARLGEADDTARALRAQAGAQRAIVGALARLRTTAEAAASPVHDPAARLGRAVPRLVALAEAGARAADEGLAATDGRAALEGEERSMAALQEILSSTSGEGRGEEGDDDGDAPDGGAALARGRVDVPPPEAFAAPRERRRAVIDALRRGVDAEHAPAALRYARWLLR